MVQIRRATMDDAGAIWKAEIETAQVPGRLLSRPEELELSSFETKIRELAETGGYVVALEDEKICGHAVLEPMHLASRGHVCSLTIVVHPGRRVVQKAPAVDVRASWLRGPTDRLSSGGRGVAET